MILLITTAVLITVALGEAYARWIPLSGLPAWAALLMFHTIMSMILLGLTPALRNALKMTASTFFYVIPALVVLVGSYLLAVLWPQPGFQIRDGLGFYVASITLVPVAEEIVFRGGIARIFERMGGGRWAIYISALVFSVAHSIPSIHHITHMQIGAPLGPFLLGICCEILMRRSGSLIPGIAFHCACNATVLIFNLWSPGWLTKLSILY